MVRYEISRTPGPAEWDQFVDAHPDGRFAHLTAYHRVLADTYHLRVFTLAFFIGNQLCGLLPGVRIPGVASQPKLVSMPFSDYGGLLAGEGISLPSEALRHGLAALLRESDTRYLQIHGPCIYGPTPGEELFTERKDCLFATLPLTSIKEVETRLDQSVRKNLRRARESNLVVRNDSSESAIRKDFYPLYLRAMKHFGTPPHSLDYFCAMKSHLGDRIRLFSAISGERVVSVLWGITAASRLHICYTASAGNSLQMRPSDLLHWEMITWAIEHGYRVFDFGVARYAGQRSFKAKWGTVFHDYNHYHYPGDVRASEIRLFTEPGVLNRIWSRAVPNRLARIIGPMIRKRLGR